jgi:Sec-independent protein translocase protein TatA
VIVGPRKLPELGRALGRGLNELKKLQDEVRDMVKFDLNDDVVESTPRMSLPAESEAVAEPADTDNDEDADPAPHPAEITHSQRVFDLAEQERAAGASESALESEPAETIEPAQEPEPEPAPETQTADDSPWIYDVMDDDEPDVTQPPVGSVE